MDSIQDWIRVHRICIDYKESPYEHHIGKDGKVIAGRFEDWFEELEDEGVHFKLIHNTLLIKYLYDDEGEDVEDYCRTWVYKVIPIDNIKDFIAFENLN